MSPENHTATRIVSVICPEEDKLDASYFKALESGADVIEVRLDKCFAEAVTDSDRSLEETFSWLERAKGNDLPIIATVREIVDVGCFDRALVEKKTEIFTRLIDEDLCSIIDIEHKNLHLYEDIVEKLSEHSIQLLVSYHMISKFPTEKELLEVCEQSKAINAGIIKIAVLCANLEEGQALMHFLCKHRSDYNNLAVMGMGKNATCTRLAAPLMGSVLTYGFSGDIPQAEGQVPVRLMKRFFDDFRGQESLITPENMHVFTKGYTIDTTLPYWVS